MEQRHRDIINEHMEKLVSLTNFESILQLILNNHQNLFLESQLREFQRPEFKRKGELEKNRLFYSYIQKRGPRAYSSLLQILKDSKHETLIKLLNNPERSVSVADKLVIKKSRSFPSDPMSYKMNSYPKGLYLIINNQEFKLDSFRTGAHHDKALCELLDEMDFKGEYFENKSVEEMRALLLEFRSKEELSKVDSCIVALMSHGNVDELGNDCIAGSDSLLLRRHEVLQMFNDDLCKLPKGQPRIFIIQTCRGDGRTDDHGSVSRRSNVVDIQSPWRDTILLAPCVEGMMSNRDPETGTWFIVALIEVFQNFACSHSLEQMASMINEKFDEYFKERGANTHQVQCYIEYGVSRTLYLNPGLF